MMEISAESNARFVAFRQLVYNCSQRLSTKELHAIVYIHLYQEKENYKDASPLTILSKLESNGLFSPWNPEGLLELFRELKKQDLCSEVKEFMKTKWSKIVKKGPKTKLREDTEDLHLKATFEVAVTQATVLMQQLEAFQVVLLSEKEPREKARTVIAGAAQTAKALAERLFKAESDLYDQGMAENDEYVDLTGCISPQVLPFPQTSGISSPPLAVPQSPKYCDPIVLPSTPATNQDGDIGEYVDMTQAQTSLRSLQGYPRSIKQHSRGESTSDSWHANSIELAGCYGDSATTKKGPSIVGLSNATAVASSELETSRNIAHASSTDSVTTGSVGSSPRHGLDMPVQVSSSDNEMSFSPPPTEGAAYCNINEFQARVTKISPNLGSEATTPLSPEVTIPSPSVATKPSYPETSSPSVCPVATIPPNSQAIYSNISSHGGLREISLPPRDIHRSIPASTLLPKQNNLPESNQTKCEVEDAYVAIDSPATGRYSKESKAGSVARQPIADLNTNAISPPAVAPKPRSRPKPDVAPRRSSLSHPSHTRVGPKVTPRSARCSSIVGSLKHSVQPSQNEADYTFLQPKPVTDDRSSCTDDSGFTDELELRLIRQKATNIASLLGNSENHYYKHLCQVEQQDDTDRAYAIVQHQ